MMRNLILYLILLSFPSCATFEVESPIGWKVKYSRFWDQELSGVNFKMDRNGTVEGGIESQTSSNDKATLLLLQSLLQGGK